MSRSATPINATPFYDAINAQYTRSRAYYDAMGPRMTSAEHERFQRAVVMPLATARTIAQRSDTASQRDAMGRMAAAVSAWDAVDRALARPERIALLPLTVAQSRARSAFRDSAHRVAVVQQEMTRAMPTVALSAAVGMLVAGVAGLYVLSKVGTLRVNA